MRSAPHQPSTTRDHPSATPRRPARRPPAALAALGACLAALVVLWGCAVPAGLAQTDPEPLTLTVTPQVALAENGVILTLREARSRPIFAPSSAARLVREGHADVPMVGLTFAEQGLSMVVTFNLRGQPLGSWDVVVDGPSGSLVAPGGLTLVVPGIAAEPAEVPAADGVALRVSETHGLPVFPEGSEIRLRRAGEEDVVAAEPAVVDGGRAVTGVVALHSRTPGAWDVVVTRPQLDPLSAPAGLQVRQPSMVAEPARSTASLGVQLTLREPNGYSVFRPGASVRLTRAGQAPVIARASQVSEGGSVVVAVLDLLGRLPSIWDIEVTNPDGTQLRLAQGFAIIDPEIYLPVPEVPAADGVELMVAASAGRPLFSEGTRVGINTLTQSIAAREVEILDGGRALRALLDLRGAPRGEWDLVVTYPDQRTKLLSRGLVVTDPKLQLDPAQAVPIADRTVTLREPLGRPIFLPGSSARLILANRPDIQATSAQVSEDGTSMTATFPLANQPRGTWDLVVTHPTAPPILAAASLTTRDPILVAQPSSDGAADGVQLLLRDRDGIAAFGPGSRVRLVREGFPEIVGASPTVGEEGRTLTTLLNLRGAALGPWDVVLTDPLGTPTVLPGGFTVESPRVVAEPAQGARSGALSLTFREAGGRVLFSPGVSVRLVRGQVSVSGTQLRIGDEGRSLSATFNLANQSLGEWDVAVTAPTGAVFTTPAAFTLREPDLVLSETEAPAASPWVVTLQDRAGIPIFQPTAQVKLSRAGQPDIPGTVELADDSRTALRVSFDLRGKARGLWNLSVSYSPGISQTLTGAVRVVDPTLLVTPEESLPLAAARIVLAQDRGLRVFDSETTLRITHAGGAELTPSGVSVSEDGSELASTLDLRGKPLGAYDVAVTGPSGPIAALPGGFMVREPRLVSRPADAVPAGEVALTVSDEGSLVMFGPQATARLRRPGRPDLTPISVERDRWGRRLLATFDLRGQPLGAYDLVVVNPGGPEPSAAGALTLLEPALELASPEGGQTGRVTLVVREARSRPIFGEGTRLRLRRGGEEIEPLTPGPADVDPGGARATFDLRGRTGAPWDVVVTLPGGGERVLSAAFTVRPGGHARVTTEIAAPAALAPERWSDVTVTFTNRGNVDAWGAPVIHGLPAGVEWQIAEPPRPLRGAQPLDWRLFEQTVGGRRALVLPEMVLPPGTQLRVRLRLKAPASVTRLDLGALWTGLQ